MLHQRGCCAPIVLVADWLLLLDTCVPLLGCLGCRLSRCCWSTRSWELSSRRLCRSMQTPRWVGACHAMHQGPLMFVLTCPFVVDAAGQDQGSGPRAAHPHAGGGGVAVPVAATVRRALHKPAWQVAGTRRQWLLLWQR